MKLKTLFLKPTNQQKAVLGIHLKVWWWRHPTGRQVSLEIWKLRSETKPGGSHVATFLTFVLEAGAAPVVAGESTLGPANEKDETRFSSQSGASWGLRGPGPCCKTRTVWLPTFHFHPCQGATGITSQMPEYVGHKLWENKNAWHNPFHHLARPPLL